jgi:Tfp pilus assembly protein PilX
MRRAQRGFTMLVGLIMLILMTLFAVSTFHLGKGSLQAVGNMQQRNQVLSAAQGTIDEVVSSANFTNTPKNAITAPCSLKPNTRCFDTNASGKNDITVTLTPDPACVKAKTIRNAELKLNLPDDVGCAIGQQQTMGQVGSVTGNSLCSDSLWDIRAEAVDTDTSAKAAINQGVAVRVSTDVIAIACP